MLGEKEIRQLVFGENIQILFSDRVSRGGLDNSDSNERTSGNPIQMNDRTIWCDKSQGTKASHTPYLNGIQAGTAM